MVSRALAFVAIALLVGACAQSPLYNAGRVPGGTRDEVPRDGNGEPILSGIRPMPPLALLPPPAAPPPVQQ